MSSVDVDFCPFEVLGLLKSRTLEITDLEVRRAWRKLAFKYHPDKNPGNNSAREKFERCKLASEILLNPELKQKYNLLEQAKEEQR